MLTNLIGGIVVENCGWEIMFHAPAIITLLWCTVWWFRVFETPEKHSTISDKELQYIVSTRMVLESNNSYLQSFQMAHHFLNYTLVPFIIRANRIRVTLFLKVT